MFVSLLIAAAAATTAPAAAPSVAPAEVTAPVSGAPSGYAPPKAADQKDFQLVCRSEAVLGSRLPVRRCRTVADIKDRGLQDRQQIEHAQQNLNLPSK